MNIAAMIVFARNVSRKKNEIGNENLFAVSALAFSYMILHKPYQGIFPKTQGYGPASGLAYKFHYGLDFALPRGTFLIACFDCVVEKVNNFFIPMRGYGRYVVLRSRSNPDITALYAHCDNISVRVGDVLPAGFVIGRSGNSGYVVSLGGGGYHLHFALQRNGKWFDPLPFFSHNVEVSLAPAAPSEAVPAGVPAAGRDRSYTVRSGDSLWKLAQRFYGDGQFWDLIFEANKNVISEPNRITPGVVLFIPPKK